MITIWEHEWNEMCTNDEDVISFLRGNPYEGKLLAREAFFGGRTDSVALYYKINGAEQIKYLDFTSLYPAVLKAERYPLHAPEIILENFKPLEHYFGLIKCTILPPDKLYHAVLPVKHANKLLFPLCGKRVMTDNDSMCQCSDNERCLKGVGLPLKWPRLWIWVIN